MHSAGRRTTFDEVAELYEQARPGYPDDLIRDVISLACLPPHGRILEIGCGTGQATLPLAERGYAMLCLEPGPNLAELAKRKLRRYPAVEVKVIKFEDWQIASEAYDLVISANAFHWIPPELGYPKVAMALKASGAMALFRNATPYAESDFLRELQRAYEEHAPQLAEGAPRQPSEDSVDLKKDEIERTGLFQDLVVKHYPWSVEYDAKGYLELLDTYSDHRGLPRATKRSLYQAISRLIERHGGAFTKPYDAVLYLARKRVA